MENAQFKILSNGIRLYFDGCDLDHAEYEERSGEKVEFGDWFIDESGDRIEKDWFIDESGDRIEIEIKQDERHPYDKDDPTLYAYIQIEGSTVKKLEIFEYPHGTVYIEPSDNDDY